MYLDLYECFFFVKQISNESVTNNALTRAGGRKCVTSHKVSLSDVNRVKSTGFHWVGSVVTSPNDPRVTRLTVFVAGL